MVGRIWRDLNLNLNFLNSEKSKISLDFIDILEVGKGSREIFMYVVKIMGAMKFIAPQGIQFHAKGFKELLQDVYQHSIYQPGLIAGEEKHSYNTVQVLAEIDKRGIISG